MKGKKKALAAVAISLVLCLASMIGASLVQTQGGSVTIKDMRWETPSGYQMSALLFIPPNATRNSPAPAIVTSHGWYNNREMQDLNAIEYSRRGYVVLSIDMYGHGNSQTIVNEDLTKRGTGMYDAVELMATLPYVDKEKIAVTGHSNGARACNLSIDEDNKKEKPLISAVLLVANDATYKNPETKEYWNKYGNRDVGIIAAQYDEFFFRVAKEDGTRTAPRDYINQETAQSFLNFGADPAKTQLEKRTSYTMYKQEIDGKEAIRVIYNPAQIHPWNHFSKDCVSYGIEYFESAFGAPNPIDGNNQIWQIKAIFNLLGLLGFGIFIVSFTVAMVYTRTFESLRAAEPAQAAETPKGAGKAWFWGGLAVSALVSGGTYLGILSWASAAGHQPQIFYQAPPYGIGLWAALCGITTIVIMVLSYFLYGKKHGVDLKETGVRIGLRKLGKTVLLAVIVVTVSYSIVFVADYFFKADFRIWALAIKAFEADKLVVALPYLPLFLLFYVANSVAINCFNYNRLGKHDFINTGLLALVNSLGPIVIVALQYSNFFITGQLFFKISSSSIGPIWLFPVIVILAVAAVISRKIYRVTKNPYLAGIINAFLVTIISCSNTLTILPK